jgi:hypothetical protein
LSPGRAERQGFECYRHGTLSLYAALNTRTGEVVGHTAAPSHDRGIRRFLQTAQPRPGHFALDMFDFTAAEGVSATQVRDGSTDACAKRRVVRRRGFQAEAQKVAQGEGIRRTPCDPAFGVDALEIANQ